ncbi:Uncharacterised protein [Mycobacteroides abscessus subsp. abscessus]|nr:Uncharacterised protein [Mycobacteroides abscessus subsp. abscessus]
MAARSVGRAPISAPWTNNGATTSNTARTHSGELRASSVLEPPGCAARATVLVPARRRCSS